jgi:ABC-type Co2+ transport system permease subunit
MESDAFKLLLTAIVIVVGSPSLPLTGGTSAPVILGLIAGIWGIDWDGS